MKGRCFFVCILILGGISAYAQPKPEEVFQNALVREATLNYSYEDVLNDENQKSKTIVKQKRNSDGSIWRVSETKGNVDLSKRYWSFDTKKIYNSEGCIDLWISQNEVTGIVTQEEIPRHRIAKDSKFKMTSVTYDGRNCWKISEHQVNGIVYEVIIDKRNEFILATSDYDSSGKLLFSTHRKNVDFNPVFAETDFCVPPNAKLQYAKNTHEYIELSIQRVRRHSKSVIKKRRQMEAAPKKTQGKLRQQWNRMTRFDTIDFILQKAPWFLMPMAICAIGIVVWKKGKHIIK